MLFVAACGNNTHPALSESPSTTATSSAAQAAPPTGAPLPPPEALTDVLHKLADPDLPGDQKVGLVEGATPADAAKFDAFGKALRDSGYLPLDITAENVAWATDPPGNVTADVTLQSQSQSGNGFTFPMEFAPTPEGGWQLSRTTADILLTFGQHPATPPPPPSPTR